MKYFLIFFTFCHSVSFCQLTSKVGIKGSFVIAAASKDGIIMAADSRAVIFEQADSLHTTLAYYDSVQKIFPIGRNMALGIMGSSLVGSNSTYTVVMYYLQNRKSEVSADSLLIDFLSFYKKFLKPNVYSQLIKNDFISIGYKRGKPFICSCSQRSKIKTPVCVSSRNDSVYLQADKRSLFGNAYSPNKSSDSLAKEAERSIIYYSKNYSPQFTVGGQVSVLKISKDGKLLWLMNRPKESQFKSFYEIREAYNNNRLGVIFVKPEYKLKVDYILNN